MKKDTSLYEVHDYAPLIFFDAEITKRLKQVVTTDPVIDIVDKETHVGIEVEVEKVNGKELPALAPVWNVVSDGSLRNRGLEFVSFPVRGENVHKSLIMLKQILDKYSAGYEFTERTSIHVHVNARNMTLEQLFSFLLIYLTVERSLFRFVEKSGFIRDKNIFCAPIQDSQAYLSLVYLFECWFDGNYDRFYTGLSGNWKKYTSMNMLPIRKKGTIEFRQMGGTLDTKLLMDWINLILCIKVYAIVCPLSKILEYIENLNTNSNYNAFTFEIFGRYAELFSEPLFTSRIEEGIVAIKECIVQAKQAKETNKQLKMEVVKDSSTLMYLAKRGYEITISNINELLEKQLALVKTYEVAELELSKLKGPHAEKNRLKKLLQSTAKQLAELVEKIELLKSHDWSN